MTITFIAAIKPHLTLKEVQAMTNEISNFKPSTNISEFLRKESTGASFGNIDASDLKPPQLKLLAGQSPEVLDGVPGAVPGNFWITILNQNLGPSVTGSPILLRKTYQVWAPKSSGSDQKGPLAVASDGVNWDVPHQSFEVKFLGKPRTYTWKLGRTVAETGAQKFGSSQDDDKSSKPIATLTYNILWLIDLPNGQKQLCVFTTSRTGVKPTQNFISTTKAMGIDQFYQRYRIVVQKKTGPTGDPYFAFDYQYAGEVESVEEAKTLRGLYDNYAKSGFVTDMMSDEAADVHTQRHTEGSSRDYTETRRHDDEDRDEIPF
jgi:hypothetical protein